MAAVEGDMRARVEADGVEFIFAMFVDMHGQPCAKMVPVEALDVIIGRWRGFRRFRSRSRWARRRPTPT